LNELTTHIRGHNDNGIFHILEHSVLCGSAKYPVKEPFVELLKGSFNTFLNAMTFPDKTMYPVSSKNEKDLEILMDIYLDAVFNPNLKTNPNILAQEGWHYHLEDKEDELISKLSKEIFEARYNEFMEVVDTILKEELNKVYTLKDLYSGKYFFDKSKLEKDDVIGNYPILDDFCLYYVIDKNKDDDRTEILGFYSLYYNDFSEHIGENKDIKSILIGQRNLDEDDFVKAIVDLYEF